MNPGLLSQNRKKRTLIIVRRVLTEPNAALAGVIGKISFARFRASIVTFNEESVLSRPFGCWGLVFMVEIRSYGQQCGLQAVGKDPNPMGGKHPPDRMKFISVVEGFRASVPACHRSPWSLSVPRDRTPELGCDTTLMTLDPILRAAAHLINKTTPTDHGNGNLQSVLSTRLSKYYTERGVPEVDYDKTDLSAVQLQTAKEALFVVRQVHDALTLAETDRSEKAAMQSEIPVLGTRDVSHLRTLISIVFKWGTDALLDHVVPNWTTPALPKAQGSAFIVDLTRGPEDYKELCDLTYRLLSIVLPSGHREQLSESFVANVLLTRHLSDVLKPCITLGWLPKALSTPSTPVQDDIRPLTMRLLS